MISFKPKQITKDLLNILSERAIDIIKKRYGLNDKGDSYTLESIGQSYGITRERVRQIENHAIKSIRKSDVYKQNHSLFAELQKLIDQLGGGLIAEHILLDELTSDPVIKNHLYFLLVVGDSFDKDKENINYHHRWFTKSEVREAVETALDEVYQKFHTDELVSEEEIINRFKVELDKLNDEDNLKEYKDRDMLLRWLNISKKISPNPLGDWGQSDSPNVRVKGIRDYAYLTLKRNGSPMHFREVAETIKELFGHDAHVATTHNELIKDPRFVLVGRGLYALTEWGYAAGVVKDVLREILAKEGPLSREELIDRVRRERYVKDNTILVNLQDTNLFKRLANGTYSLAE